MSEHTHTPPSDHHLKIPHLVFGLLFLGIAGIWALGSSDLISGERLTILAPAVLVAAGVIGLAASLASGRNRSRATYEPAAEHTSFHDPVGYADPADDDPTQEIR